jgi:hypothetical protein
MVSLDADAYYLDTQNRVRHSINDGKLVERQGRKATGLKRSYDRRVATI